MIPELIISVGAAIIIHQTCKYGLYWKAFTELSNNNEFYQDGKKYVLQQGILQSTKPKIKKLKLSNVKTNIAIIDEMQKGEFFPEIQNRTFYGQPYFNCGIKQTNLTFTKETEIEYDNNVVCIQIGAFRWLDDEYPTYLFAKTKKHIFGIQNENTINVKFIGSKRFVKHNIRRYCFGVSGFRIFCGLIGCYVGYQNLPLRKNNRY